MQIRLNRIHFLFVVIILFAESLKAQIAINFNAAVYGQSLEGLAFVQISNTTVEDVTASVTIKVRENSVGNIVVAKLTSVPLRKGNNTLDRTAFSKGIFSFGNNYYGITLSQTGKFPEGEYEYCFEIEITESKSTWINTFFENCFVHDLQQLTPLLLIHPDDGDENCNTRPHFLWQLPFPLPLDSRCRLILTEIKDKQEIAEAINFNIPLINRGNIIGNQLVYPSEAPSLKEGKKYAWQVIVYTDKTILKKSEIWIYNVTCVEMKQEQNTDSYREITEIEDGNFYIATRILRFSFNNSYGTGDLNYTIINKSNPELRIRNLPGLKMHTGLNKYDIDLSENKSFKDGEEYLLRIKLINNRELLLRFIYKTE